MHPKPKIWARALETKDNTTRFVVSTQDPARDTHIIDQSSWSLDNYRANPVVLWTHDYDTPPVGRAVDLGVDDNALHASVEWDTATELGATVARQYAQGFLSAVSVGWIPGNVTPRSSYDRSHPFYGDDGVVFTNNEMLEFSAVTVPTDPGALAARGLPMPKPANLSMAELVEWIRHANTDGPELDGAAILAAINSAEGRQLIAEIVWGSRLERTEEKPDPEDWFARMRD